MRTIQCFHFAPSRGWSQWFVSCSPQWRCFCTNLASFITVYHMLNVSKIFFGFQQTCTYRWQISHLKLLIISIFHLNLMLMFGSCVMTDSVCVWSWSVTVWMLQDEECLCRSSISQVCCICADIDVWMMYGRIKLWI